MTFPKARLAVSACLLVAWLGYLGFLVYETRDAVVLSRPQFMIAQVYAVVNVRDQQGRADADVEVVWASSANGEVTLPPRLLIPDVADCAKEQGYRGAGKYLLPLTSSSGNYKIAPLPHGGICIYPWTPETEAQLKPFLGTKK
jgi:hypothetical protein